MKRKVILMLLVVTAALSSFCGSDIAIKVDDLTSSKKGVFVLASRVFNEKSKRMGPGEISETEIIRKIILDGEFWMIATAEGRRRGIPEPPIEDVRAMSERLKGVSDYAAVDFQTFNVEALSVLRAHAILAADGIAPPESLVDLRDEIISRYGQNHEIEIADYSNWRIDKRYGSLVKDSDYDAIEHELTEDSWMLTKVIYYVHHYTVRYYVKFLKWYVATAEAAVAFVKERCNETVAGWISKILMYVIPYLFHVLVIFLYAKIDERKVRLFSMLFLALLLSGVSTILFYFGMSPWSLFVVCVGVPLGIYLAPSILDIMSGGGSSCSGGSSSYSSGGGASFSGGSGEDRVVTTITDEDGCEYKGEGKDPDTIEKQTPGDHAIFDRCIDGSYKERFGDRELKKPW